MHVDVAVIASAYDEDSPFDVGDAALLLDARCERRPIAPTKVFAYCE